MTREAKIILPRIGNNGDDIEGARTSALSALVRAFGGVTVHEAAGYWTSDDGTVQKEPVTVCTVAIGDTDNQGLDSGPSLIFIARDFARAARQESVYVRHASGAVEFVKVQS